MAANMLERFEDDAELHDRERTIPRLRHPGLSHAAARDRAPRIERGSALRILAEPALIDEAFGRYAPELVGYAPMILELLMNRR